MNKRNKEVEATKLRAEDKVLKDLKREYSEAAKRVKEKIKTLADREQSQSVIYQRKYQEQLAKQIDSALASLDNVNTISDYLRDSYTNGYLGALYDIQGQGIPIITPFDQNAVTKMISTTSDNIKLSKKLYSNLTALKNRVRKEVSIGIAAGEMYDGVAARIDRAANIGFNNAYRIARTEGHRVAQSSALDAMHAAKDSGADVVKQWDATLDGRTRKEHRKLDGQIRELDEQFEVGGRKAQRPGGFGRAEQDINCRCTMLQRARWALDDEELETLKERAAYFELDKTNSFEEYKSKFLKAVEELERVEDTAEDYAGIVVLTTKNFPKQFQNGAAGKRTKQLVDYINTAEENKAGMRLILGDSPEFMPANEKMLKLYNNMNKFADSLPFEIKYKSNGRCSLSSYRDFWTNEVQKRVLNLPMLKGENIQGQINTTIHEIGHLFDSYAKDVSHKLNDVISRSSFRGDNISDDIKKIFKNANVAVRLKYDEIKREFDIKINELERKRKVAIDNKDYDAWIALDKEIEKAIKELNNLTTEEMRNTMKGVQALQDIYDALSGGSLLSQTDIIMFGHGSMYYSQNPEKQAAEIWANYCALSIMRPDLIEVLRKDKPLLVEKLDEILDELVEGL